MSVPESISGLVSLALWLLVTLLIVKVISKTVGVLLRILIAAVAALAIVYLLRAAFGARQQRKLRPIHFI